MRASGADGSGGERRCNSPAVTRAPAAGIERHCDFRRARRMEGAVTGNQRIVPGVAAAEPRYRRHEGLGLETCFYRGPLPRMPSHVHPQYQLTLYAGRRGASPSRGNPHGRHAHVGDLPGERATREHADRRRAHGSPHVLYRAGHDAGSRERDWHRAGPVVFGAARLTDSSTVAMLHAAHRSLEEGGLHGEVAFYTALEQLVRRCAAPAGPARKLARSDARTAQVRDLPGGPRGRKRSPRRVGAGRRD